jgi:hypothetical protein
MSFFKKIGKSVNKAFTKAPEAISSIFKKGGDIAQKVSGGLGKVSDVLGKVADVGGKILSNPLTEAAATAVGGAFGMPEAGALLGMAGQGLKRIKQGSELAGRASGLAGRAGALSTEASKYKSLADARGGIQKAKELVSDARGVAGPSFA